MKLFSRKALVAGATAVAISFAGTSVATAQDNEDAVTTQDEPTQEEGTQDEGSDNEGEENTNDDENNNDDSNNDNADGNKDDEEEDDLSSDPKEITAWISVFTAVIGALGTLFTFANKHFDFMA